MFFQLFHREKLSTFIIFIFLLLSNLVSCNEEPKKPLKNSGGKILDKSKVVKVKERIDSIYYFYFGEPKIKGKFFYRANYNINGLILNKERCEYISEKNSGKKNTKHYTELSEYDSVGRIITLTTSYFVGILTLEKLNYSYPNDSTKIVNSLRKFSDVSSNMRFILYSLYNKFGKVVKESTYLTSDYKQSELWYVRTYSYIKEKLSEQKLFDATGIISSIKYIYNIENKLIETKYFSHNSKNKNNIISFSYNIYGLQEKEIVSNQLGEPIFLIKSFYKYFE